ncbi:31872_t:CDS:2, partial [Racocetra persica]
QVRVLAEEIRERISRQAEEAKKEVVYNEPLPFFAEKRKYQPPKTSDQRLNTQRAEIFPNLPRTNQEPTEAQSRYHTTVEDESEAAEVIDESENENNDQESNQELTPELNHGDNSNENNHQEPNNNDDNENGENTEPNGTPNGGSNENNEEDLGERENQK